MIYVRDFNLAAERRSQKNRRFRAVTLMLLLPHRRKAASSSSTFSLPGHRRPSAVHGGIHQTLLRYNSTTASNEFPQFLSSTDAVLLNVFFFFPCFCQCHISAPGLSSVFRFVGQFADHPSEVSGTARRYYFTVQYVVVLSFYFLFGSEDLRGTLAAGKAARPSGRKAEARLPRLCELSGFARFGYRLRARVRG